MKYKMLNPTASMTQDGEFASRILQNNTTPYIDIFARESIQNCLDAGDESCPEKYVIVNFIINKFNKRNLNRHLEKVEDKINNLIPEEDCSFIAIKDQNTTGLIGALKSTDIRNCQTGNFRSLVYNIGKRQTGEGAGGAWGIGKTSFYRLSKIGLLLYYSRIKQEDGSFESRLAAAMIEDSSKEGVLEPDENGNKSGIAWWGAGVDDNNEPYPITDTEEILSILSVFDIEEFKNDEIGTIVIIPYIDEDKLLKNAITISDEDGDPQPSSWANNLPAALKTAIQRWWAPRLDNEFYYRDKLPEEKKAYKYLKAFINGEEIKYDNTFPIFKVLRDLYNASLAKILDSPSPEKSTDIELESSVITYNRVHGDLGVLSYAKVKKSILSVGDDNNPYKFVDINNNGDNRIIACMVRRPGMIVQYNPFEWIKGLPESDPDECIISLFVLSPSAYLDVDGTPDKMILEEYIRMGGENADHLGWHDHPVGKESQNRNCVYKIFSKCHDTLLDAFGERPVSDKTNTVKGLSTLLAKVLKIKPNRRGGGSHEHIPLPTVENGIAHTISEDIKYSKDSMTLIVDAKAKNMHKASMSLCLNMDTTAIDCNKWEKDTMLKSPFSIKKCTIILKSFDGVGINETVVLEKNQVEATKLIKYKKNYTCRYNNWFNVEFETIDTGFHELHMEFRVEIILSKKDFRPNIKF